MYCKLPENLPRHERPAFRVNGRMLWGRWFPERGIGWDFNEDNNTSWGLAGDGSRRRVYAGVLNGQSWLSANSHFFQMNSPVVSILIHEDKHSGGLYDSLGGAGGNGSFWTIIPLFWPSLKFSHFIKISSTSWNQLLFSYNRKKLSLGTYCASTSMSQ